MQFRAFESSMKIGIVIISFNWKLNIKEQYFPVVLFIVLYKVVPMFETADKIL